MALSPERGWAPSPPIILVSSVLYDDSVSTGHVMRVALLIAVVVLFIFLILKDAVKALRRRAHWIPGNFLVLGAFTIQLLNLLIAQVDPIDIPSEEDLRKKASEILSSDFWMIHASRIMLCVVVAIMMPGMAIPGSEGSWGKLMALSLTIFLHVTSELYIVRRTSLYFSRFHVSVKQNLYIEFAALVFLCFILLILLLGCANIAGRGIELIVAQKIPLILTGLEDLHNDSHKKIIEHSCWRTVKDAVLRVNTDHCQSCCQMVEDIVERADKEKAENLHSLCQCCWQTVEDAVLRAWIVARTFSLENIIARSVLASSAALIVTIQIVITMVGGVKVGVYNRALNFIVWYDWYDWYDWLRFTATILQCIFILIGWFIITWRWVTEVAYYRKCEMGTWKSGFMIEDFWTRHLRELLQAQEPRLHQAEVLDTKISGVVAKEQIAFTVPRKLLYAVIGLQWLTVTFSKACWLASWVIFHNKLMDILLSFILSRHEEHIFERYKQHEKLLEGVQMLGETPKSLWLANRKSIEKAKKLVSKGEEDGKPFCEHLVPFLVNKTTHYGIGRRCLEPYKRQTELKYLCKKRPTQQPQEEPDQEKQQPREEENGLLAVEKHFANFRAKSWKMTAVSLLSIIVHLSPIYAAVDKENCSTSHAFPLKAVEDCMEAYSEAWEIIDFVEETDREANEITGQAADKYFDILQRKVKKGPLLSSNFRHATPQCVRGALEELKMESKSKTEPPGSVNLLPTAVCAVKVKDKKEKGGDYSKRWEELGGNDSLDWKTAASGNAVYKLCSSTQCDDGADVNELLKELQSSLADIINECLEKTQYLLLLNSKKWARNSDEKRMARALYIAGKAKMIMTMLYPEDKTIVEERSEQAILPIE